MKIQLEHGAQTHSLELTPAGKGYALQLDGVEYAVEILRAEPGRLTMRLSGQPASESGQSAAPSVVTAYISTDGAKRWVTVNGKTWLLTRQSGSRRAGGHHHHAAGELVAPMPGQVRAINVAVGDAVTKGQTVAVVEAMKMELKITAPFDGVVQSVSASIGQTVEREQLLVTLSQE